VGFRIRNESGRQAEGREEGIKTYLSSTTSTCVLLLCSGVNSTGPIGMDIVPGVVTASMLLCFVIPGLPAPTLPIPKLIFLSNGPKLILSCLLLVPCAPKSVTLLEIC
jgi:hypothetical protein